MKTRIDIISGYYGAGKTELISKLLTCSPSFYERVTVCKDTSGAAGSLADTLVQLIFLNHPGRILLEAAGAASPDVFHALFCDERLIELAYKGAHAFVLDGFAFLKTHAAMQRYYETQIRHASVVFVNHMDELDSADRLKVLTRIWVINRHVNLMVEPLVGIDLWGIIDLPSIEQFGPGYGYAPGSLKPSLIKV